MDGMGSWLPNKFSAYEIDGSLGIMNGEKLIFINTIVSYMIYMFDDNGVVRVIALTGMTVFNVPGYTLHRFAGLDWWNMKKGITNSMEK
jgi:hypothetical protein